MENLLLLLASAFLFRQEEKLPKVVAVSTCGRTALLPSAPVTRRLQDEIGNEVYIGQAAEGSAIYGFASLELLKPLHTQKEAEAALFLFMEDMHPSFGIEYTTGLAHGYTHPNSEAVWGMTDYWQDSHGTDWKVKGWTDGNVMTVLYVKGISHASVEKQEAFLNSFQFNPTQKLVQ